MLTLAFNCLTEVTGSCFQQRLSFGCKLLSGVFVCGCACLDTESAVVIVLELNRIKDQNNWL